MDRAFRNRTVVIVGGGLAGLVSSILLQRYGFEVTLIERKQYPFHRVCGEYVSNEVLPFFKRLGIDLEDKEPSRITDLAVSSVSGELFKTRLDLGGFGLSRYVFDHLLYQKALEDGVTILSGTKAIDVVFKDDRFETELADRSKIHSNFVICAHGKRSNLDKGRSFFFRRSPYVGVKYHIKTDFPKNLVQLDNFPGGYCGTVKIEGDKYCLCYLSRNHQMKNAGSVIAFEKEVLYKNPFLRTIFGNSDFLYEKPEVISEISFDQKSLVENHVLFCGDAAGMISPLCGNGMAIAIHAAYILADAMRAFKHDRNLLEQTYQQRWKEAFSRRLSIGRMSQKLFGSDYISSLAVKSLKTIRPLSKLLIKGTHGNPF